MENVKLHEIYEVFVRDLGVHGEGIGNVNGFTVFVKGALSDEIVKAEITLVKKTYALGKLISIVKKSPDRIESHCIPDVTCGACQIPELSYEGQLKFKFNRVKSVISRIGKQDENKVLPVVSATHIVGYRNKMSIPIGTQNGKAVSGYYKSGTHEIIPSTDCMIQNETNNKLAKFAQDFINKNKITVYNEKTHKGSMRHIVGRIGDDGKLMAVIVTSTNELPCKEKWIEEMRKSVPEVISIYHNVQDKKTNVILGNKMEHIWGEKTLKASIGKLTFEISPYSFFQVNKEQVEKLYEKALDFANLSGNETVIDAYCGTGTISLYLAQKAKHVIGIEIIEDAIENAKENAKRNKIKNVEFHAADVAKYLPELAKKGIKAEVVVLDPVRAGCDEKVIEAIGKISPERIVYVSCNVATQARDIERLSKKGYKLIKIQPIDMFPQTTHVETVALMERVKIGNNEKNTIKSMKSYKK